MTERLEQRALDAALRLFTTTFVVDDKQKQMQQRLATAERRLETLEALPRWIRTRNAPLEGADRSPAGLRKRFGELSGVVLDEAGATRTTIANALDQHRTTPSLFIADNGSLAMITTRELPILCSRL
jgi:hypothetical protein